MDSVFTRLIEPRLLTVGASNHDIEAVTPLALVGRLRRSHRCAPQRAFVVCGARWIRAVLGIWVERGVSLDVYIESLAAVRFIAPGRTGKDIVAVERGEAHEFGCAERAILA